ncbi:MAG: YlxR family protein [Clostridia bacterium]|nr:YlxR family protein [Clostridia bacterium]
MKRIPLRRCLGCGESRPKNVLMRIVRSPEGEISLDVTGKKSGRGAYVCRSSACFAKARRSRRADRALEVAIPDAIYDQMEREIAELEKNEVEA